MWEKDKEMTNMPEVIWVYEDENGHFYAENYEIKRPKHVAYIRSDKHEELKAIAEKMLNAINNAGCYCWFDGDTLIEECKRCEVKTEYNKYKGGWDVHLLSISCF